jgi:malonate transporter
LIVSRGAIAESTIKGLAAAYGNIGYMGPGLALLALRAGGRGSGGAHLLLREHRPLRDRADDDGAGGRREGVARQLALGVVKRIALHPFIIATAVGVLAAWAQYEPPVPVARLSGISGAGGRPLRAVRMGVTLALQPLRRVPRELGAIVTLKLVVHPILCYVVLSLIGNFSEVWVFSAVLLAGLPTATNVFVIAQQYGVWVQRASASLLLTTVLSVVSVTGLLYLIRNGILPPDLFP